MAFFEDRLTMFDDLMKLQDGFNRYFDGRVTRYPPLNAWVSDESLVVDLEMPGIETKDVDISVMGDQLTVSGKREASEGSHRTYYKRERVDGSFSRSLELPFMVQADKVTANYRNGILRITLPRSETDKPRKIEISAA